MVQKPNIFLDEKIMNWKRPQQIFKAVFFFQVTINKQTNQSREKLIK